MSCAGPNTMDGEFPF